MTFCKAVLSLAVLLLVSTPLVLAQGTYTQIDVPGAIDTFAYGIDSAGDLVGYYIDAAQAEHGFLLSGGTYTTIDYPNGQFTAVFGMNDVGELTGFAYTGVYVGFVDNTQTDAFTAIEYPGAYSTIAYRINNSGTIAGFFQQTSSSSYEGFELAGTTYRLVQPNALASEYLVGVTASGELLGRAQVGTGGLLTNFLCKNGKYELVKIPSGLTFEANGISPDGTRIVGALSNAGVMYCLLYQNRTVTYLSFLGSVQTSAWGVNNSGTVVGYFFSNATGSYHGFTWTPPADAAKK